LLHVSAQWGYHQGLYKYRRKVNLLHVSAQRGYHQGLYKYRRKVNLLHILAEWGYHQGRYTKGKFGTCLGPKEPSSGLFKFKKKANKEGKFTVILTIWRRNFFFKF
jgi:hypothetical protein